MIEVFLFLYTLEVGYTPQAWETNQPFQEDLISLSFSPDLVFFNILHITGTAQIGMILMGGGSTRPFQFNPLSLTSKVEIYADFKGLQIGLLYTCQHPIQAWTNLNTTPYATYNMASNYYFIRFKGGQQ